MVYYMDVWQMGLDDPLGAKKGRQCARLRVCSCRRSDGAKAIHIGLSARFVACAVEEATPVANATQGTFSSLRAKCPAPASLTCFQLAGGGL